MQIKTPIIALILFFALISCKGPQASTQTIVTVKHDTLITKELHRDTIFNNSVSHDTIYLREDRLTIKYLQKTDSSAYLGGTVSPDTVIKVYRDTLRQTTVIKEVDKPLDGWDNFCRWFVGLLLAGGLIYLGIKNFPSILKILKGGL